jgi:hypothetical protein
VPDEIRFIASYGGWKAEKRLQISDSTGNPEIVRLLSEIRKEAGAKAFELTGIDVAAIKSCAASEASGKSGAQALASLNQAKIRAKLKGLCKEGQLPFAEALFNHEMLRLLGVKLAPGA